MTERQSTREANIRNDGKVVIRNENADIIEKENLVNIYNDHVEQLNAMRDNVSSIEEEIEDVLADEDNNMMELHTVLKDEPQNEGKVDPNTVTSTDLQNFQELQQKKQQREQYLQSVQQIEEFLSDIEDTVKQVVDEVDDVEMKEFQQDEGGD